jgi:lysophospholipase L1-like esterase
MTDKAKILDQLRLGAVINILGDSLAAGSGSSGSCQTDEIILRDGSDVFYRRVAPNSWWGRLEAYLKDKYPQCTVINSGCSGAYSYQIRNGLDQLLTGNEDIVMLLIGVNDRKRENGMAELYENLTAMIHDLKTRDKLVLLLTPNPSTVQNELHPTRIYHTEDVANIILHTAEKEEVLLVDNYNCIQDYLFLSGKKIDDIIVGENCDSDGLHPADFVQQLMFRNLMRTLGLSLKVDGAVW